MNDNFDLAQLYAEQLNTEQLIKLNNLINDMLNDNSRKHREDILNAILASLDDGYQVEIWSGNDEVILRNKSFHLFVSIKD